jgi:hypothetical protein
MMSFLVVRARGIRQSFKQDPALLLSNIQFTVIKCLFFVSGGWGSEGGHCGTRQPNLPRQPVAHYLHFNRVQYEEET